MNLLIFTPGAWYFCKLPPFGQDCAKVINFYCFRVFQHEDPTISAKSGVYKCHSPFLIYLQLMFTHHHIIAISLFYSTALLVIKTNQEAYLKGRDYRRIKIFELGNHSLNCGI